MSEKHWNDEMIELERKAMNDDTNQPSMEPWDWRWRAEQAEAQIKKLEAELKEYDTLIEQSKVAIYQVQSNFHSMTRRMRKLLMMCLKHLDPAEFYYGLDTNPHIRRQQIEERTKMKNELVDALKDFLNKTESNHG